jgi:hypothetical protein
MSIKLYDLDKQGDYEEYKRKEADMKKNRNYSNMYKTGDEGKENLQNESEETKFYKTHEEADLAAHAEGKSADPVVEKKPEIYAGNLTVSPNTKGEVVKVDNLRVRKTPNSDGEVICTIPRKMIVNVLSKTDARNPWYEIEKKTDKGYIHGHVMGDYLDVYVDG